MAALSCAFFIHVSNAWRRRLPFILNREVDQRRRAAESRGDGAGLEIVGRGGSAERHVEMRVHIDSAWKQQMIAEASIVPVAFSGESCAAMAEILPPEMPTSATRRVCRGDDRAVS